MKKTNLLIILMLFAISMIAQTEVVLNVGTVKRQELKGYGASLTDNIDNIPESARKAMSDLVYRDMQMNTMRLWKHDQTNFWKHYVNTNAIKWAREGGVTTLLLAPGGKNPETNMTAYAKEIATIAKRLRTETGFPLNVTGVANEPDFWTAANIADGITKIRAALDANGDQSVKIIAPESSNCDDHWYDIMNEVKTKYPAAWNLQDYIGSHSYNMCTLEKWGKFAFDNNKEYWMTESCNNGDDSETDDAEGTVMAGRFLNDMNHGISNWIYFIAYSSDVNDSKTKFVVWDAKKNKIRIFCKYYYMKQMFTNYHKGAIFRKVLANGTGEMNQTYGSKSRYNAAVAQNPDGTWNLSVVNGTGAQGFSPATYKFTFDVPELKDSGNIDFNVIKTNISKKITNEGKLTMVNGRISIQVGAREVITLTSGIAATEVAVSKVSISPESAELQINGTVSIAGNVVPADATRGTIFWQSTNPKIASVNETGLVTAIAPGNAKIIATVLGSNVADTSLITVLIPLKDSKLSGTIIGNAGSISGEATDKSKVFDGDLATFFDSNVADSVWVGLNFGAQRKISTIKIAPRIAWASRMVGGVIQASNNENFSPSVDLFKVETELQETVFTSVINADTTSYQYVRYLSPVGGYGNISELEFYTQTPNAPVTGISIKPSLKTFRVNTITTLIAEILPTFATNRNVSWETSNSEVVKVKPNGEITCLSVGKAILTVTSEDGGMKASLEINVLISDEKGVQLQGSIIGTEGSYDDNPNVLKEAAFDGDMSTFFDSNQGDFAWVGLDLGSPKVITKVKICPREGWTGRMVNGKIQGSNSPDFNPNVDLYILKKNLPFGTLTSLDIIDRNAYQYVRYIAPAGGWGNISELEFWYDATVGISPLSTEMLTVYPNPLTVGTATISLDKFKLQENVLVRISDMNGRVIFSQVINPRNTDNNQIVIQRSDFKAGIYLISATTNSENRFLKLLVK